MCLEARQGEGLETVVLFSLSKRFYFLQIPPCHIVRILKQVDGMDALAVKQACKFAKEHALKNGPIVSTLISCLCSSL